MPSYNNNISVEKNRFVMTRQKQLQKKVSNPVVDKNSSEFLQTRPFAPITQSRTNSTEQETQPNSQLVANSTPNFGHSFGNLPIQRQVPSTKERTKKAQVGDKHMITHPFDLGGWYKTLMTGRIADLYITSDGFLGHAQQIQQELDRLCPLIDEGKLDNSTSLATAKEYEQSIKKFIVNGAKQINFDIPKFIFNFSGSSSLAIERNDGKLLINGKEGKGKY